MYHWAYIQQQVVSRHLHSNNQVNLSIGCSEAAQQPLLLPKIVKGQVRGRNTKFIMQGNEKEKRNQQQQQYYINGCADT